MASYEGHAAIVLDDGDVIEDVEATLVLPEEGLGGAGWFGKIVGDFDAFDLMDGPARLRLPDGREAWFRLSRTDLVLPRNGIDIVGVEAPPG